MPVPNISPLASINQRIDVASPGRNLCLVGIGGHGGSGKSTLARAIASSRPEVQIVATDSFWDGTQFDLPRLRTEVVDVLLDGRPATYDEWNWAEKRPGGARTVAARGIVIVEGVCALHEMFRHDLAVRIWIDTPPQVRLTRGVARDGEGMRSTWTDVWMPSEAAYVARDNPMACAHLRLDGTAPF